MEIKKKTIKTLIGLLIVSGVGFCTTIYRTAPSDPVKKQSPAIAVPDYTADDWNQIEAERTSYRAAQEENNRQQKATVTNFKKEITYIESIPLDAGLQKWTFEHCNKNSISTYLIFALIEKESDYDSDLIGDNGQAFGLMQIQEQWHRERITRLGITDLMEPEQNIIVGIDYLVELFQTGHEVDWVLMAYNGGMEYADRNLDSGTVSSYAMEIIERAEQLRKEAEE